MGLYNFSADLLVQRISGLLGNGSRVAPRGTGAGSMAVAQVEPPRTDLGRMGARFCASAGVVANAIAPVVDVPTTASMYVLQNNYAASSRICLVVEQVGVWHASGTAGLGGMLLGGLPGTPHASALTNSTGVVGPKSCSASAKISTAVWATGATLAAAPAWIALADLTLISEITIGKGAVVVLDGLFVVPPGGYYAAFHVLAPTGTTSKFSMSAVWSEMTLDLE
ncbi:MAG: hypothetical protein L0206_16915 [Actinobacteria bacterium]|nr:hypothetical protein [Actinomycetota bacterium]